MVREVGHVRVGADVNTLRDETRERVEGAIASAVRRQLDSFEPEKVHRPFHARILGGDRLQANSFANSLDADLAAEILKPVAAALATERFAAVRLQRPLPRELNAAASAQIDAIVDGLLAGTREASRREEDELIRRAANSDGATITTRVPKVDLWLEGWDDSITMIELKTVKPNIGNFEHYKRGLLRWFALGAAHYPGRRIRTALALPYNPYHPEPYRRWTLKGMLDLDREVLIAEEFWNFLAGADIHDELLDCFERAGLELRGDLDSYFGAFRDDRNA